MRLFLIFIISISVSGCGQEYADNRSQLNYQEMKGRFSPFLTDHFPLKISRIHQTTMGLNTSKNEVGLMLYQYEMQPDTIRKIKNEIQHRAIALYRVTDDCLFIVNRFETFETNETTEVITEVDSSKANNPCYSKLYPIPNFIDVQNPVKHSDIKLNDSYVIYVLETKPGVFYKNLQKIPSPQMPEGWKNGLSKGVAVSQRDKTVIYWGIIW